MTDNIPLEDWSGAAATHAFQRSIEVFNLQAARQTRQILILTRVIAVLTAVMAIGLGVQLYLAIVD